jgi:uncharacterized protein YndB with AHSA1/START domain
MAAASRFEYVIYIRTTPDRLWRALIEPESTRQYWVETWQDCDWKVGASWKLMIPDGRVGDAGEVLEIEPEKHLALSWQNQFMPELREEGFSRMTYDIELVDNTCVKLTVTHEMDRPNSKLIAGVSSGWPGIMSSLKSLLETGQSLAHTRKWPEGM